MVARYYVAIRPLTNENHAVHKEGCPFLPDGEKVIYLGDFSSGQDAIKESKRHFSKSKGCVFCSKEHDLNEEKPLQYKLADQDIIPAEIKGPLSCHQSLFCCMN
jgi:hypothetical protein